jgi:predicted amidophosphoribosyltransferase
MELWLILLIIALFVGAIVLILVFLIKPKRTVEAIEDQGRRRYDTLTIEQEVDEEVMNKKFLCPKCNSEVYYDESECPSCQTRFVSGEYECPNCSKQVDPREKECPYCGEILQEEPFVCPNCSSPVAPDATRCDKCNASFWSPIRLDQRSLDRRRRKVEPEPTPERD